MLMFPEAHPEVGCIVLYCSLSGLYFPKSTHACTAPGKCLLFRCKALVIAAKMENTRMC